MLIHLICYTVGKIEVITQNIFENEKGIYRLANKLHIKTKPFVIYNTIPIREGSKISDTSIISEIKSKLYSMRIFYSVDMKSEIRGDTIDLKIITKDLWTLGIYTNLEGSERDRRIDIGFSDLNLLGLGTYFLSSGFISPDGSGFYGEFNTSSIIRQISFGINTKLTNYEKDFFFYSSRASWSNIKSFSYFFWISKDSYKEKSSDIVGLNVGYNIKEPRNEPFIGFRIYNYKKGTGIIGYKFSNVKYAFLKNINSFSRDEMFKYGFDNYVAFGYGFFNLNTSYGFVFKNLTSVLNSEFENNPNYSYITLSNAIYYKITDFITIAGYLYLGNMNIKDTTSAVGFRVGGLIGIRGVNYFEGFSNEIYRFSLEIRTYSKEIFSLIALGPIAFYDFAYYGKNISVYGIGMRFQITRVSVPVIRIDYANNGIISFSSGQAF